MEGIYLFFAPLETRASPIADNMHCLAHANGKCHQDRSNSHRKHHQSDRTQLELRGRACVDRHSPGVQLTEIAVDEDPGADQEDGGEKSDHGQACLLARTRFSGGFATAGWATACPGMATRLASAHNRSRP